MQKNVLSQIGQNINLKNINEIKLNKGEKKK